MKRYKIIVTFDNGDQVKANVVGRNQSDAVNRLKKTHEYSEMAEGTTVANVEITPIPIKPIDNERFAVTTIDNKPGWYIVADLDNLIKIEFKKGCYNKTQRIASIGKGKQLDELEMAEALREIGEYMHNNFRELVMKDK